MSRCAGAGREHSQAESQAGRWEYSIPWTALPACERGLAEGEAIGLLAFLGVQTFFRLRIGHQVVRKIVLYVVCFACSLLVSLLVSTLLYY